MSEVSAHVEDYLRLRRALGFKLERAGHLLPQLVAYLEAAGVATVTSELAIAWARLPAHTQPNHWEKRLAIARGFARYLQALDPATEVPPAGVFPPAGTGRRRSCGRSAISVVCWRARALRPALRAATYEALGCLPPAACRVGGRSASTATTSTCRPGVITIRHAKFDRPRLVPLHPTVTEALSRYATERDYLCPRPRARAFFVSSAGTRLDRSGVGKTLREITTSLGMRTESVHPRAHDLRHSFAVDTLIRWQRSGLSVDEHIATLSPTQSRQPRRHLLVPVRVSELWDSPPNGCTRVRRTAPRSPPRCRPFHRPADRPRPAARIPSAPTNSPLPALLTFALKSAKTPAALLSPNSTRR
jgi:hypothetical protein